MSVLRLLTCLAILITSSQAISKSNNPFNKAITVTAGSDVQWQYGDQTATKSVKSSDGSWYHLFYDGLKLRLRVTTSASDSEASAKQFNELAVKDIKVDGKRLKVFQWCLNNQEKHNRFLQQGLKVKKDICQNMGGQGTYVMRLTKDAIASLDQGDTLLFDLKPYRTAVHVKFDISDFGEANKEFKRQVDAVMAAAAEEAAQKEAAAAAAAAAVAAPVAAPVVAAPVVKPKCKAEPPKGYAGLKAIEYDCDDAAAKSKATAEIDSQVASIDEQRKKAAAEAERKRKEAEAARLAQEEALKKEQEALAASAAVQAELSSDITNKMLAVCQKQWDDGKNRCYCNKYIEFAPSHIKPNPDCQ